MTDTGSNPFAEPDFSSLHSGAEDAAKQDYGEEDYAEDVEDDLGEDDDEDDLGEDELDEDEGEDELDEDLPGDEDELDEDLPGDEDELDDGAEVGEASSLAAQGPAALEVEEDYRGNRVEGGTARSVLEHVARSIVDDPDGVSIEVAETHAGVRLSLHVAQGDMGRIIGRRGRTAQALRTLVRAAAARDGQEASVDIVD